ncbi:MAG: hypothetical protein J6R36_02695, partial [Bacteroidaceae bacterium]|nr:hypothetical protein [Bacteroidaceae bacterium]
MKRNFTTLVASIMLLAASGTVSAHRAGGRSGDPTGYKDTYKDYFTVGVAVNMRNVTDSVQMALIKR